MKLGLASAALALTALFSTAAMAAPVDVTGCTKDGKSVTLKIDVDGGIKEGPTLAALAQTAFNKTAAALTAEELVGNAAPFIINLQQGVIEAAGEKGQEALTDDFAFNGFPNGAPVIGGACKPAAPAAN